MRRPNPFTADPTTAEDRPSIPLSVPHLAGPELAALATAIESNWLGPIGPEVAAFEDDFRSALGVPHALATTSGTAALHLALRVLGVGQGDDVLVSTLTFCASVNPIIYLGARPVLVDAERASWNMDPSLLAEELARRGRTGNLPAAVVVVHLFGQMANMDPILATCSEWGVPVVEDAAEALGARTSADRVHAGSAGTLGRIGIFSFDASKMITTSMGGMLVSEEEGLVEHARKLARQAREPAPHYEHVELGYNYRMSNLLAAFGRVQLGVLGDRVAARQSVFELYREELRDIPGVKLQPEAPWGTHARWLTCLTVDGDISDREAVRLALLRDGIESRPVWKPMHLQPVYKQMALPVLGGEVSEDLFERGLCLPSSSFLTADQVRRVSSVLRDAIKRA